ncbi:MAG: hypothetical protein ACK5AZ_13795 [Bryobacteraceae bacterium]
MPSSPRIDFAKALGRSPDSLTIDERRALAGKWIALELYSPETLPLRRIEAIGDTVADCALQLRERNLDSRNFEYVALKPAY